jgi:hypothetical protein
MKPSARFALLVMLCATILFVAWPWVSSAYRAIAGGLGNLIRVALGEEPVTFLTEKDSYLLIPALAVIVAAQGFSWRRKLAFVGGAAGGLVLFGALVTAFQVGSRPVAVPGGSDVAHLPYVLFGVVFPIALVVAFVAGEPSRLWTASAREAGAGTCPVCGSATTDLKHHVTTAHGPDALRRADVKRALRR